MRHWYLAYGHGCAQVHDLCRRYGLPRRGFAEAGGSSSIFERLYPAELSAKKRVLPQHVADAMADGGTPSRTQQADVSEEALLPM